MGTRITQRDIARAAGVDVSTVSLALHRHHRIPKATQARILSLAEQMGYRPDPALSSIAACRWQGRRGVKGVVLAFFSDALSSAEPELRLYHQGVQHQAQEMGYGVTAFSLQDYASPQSFWRVIRARGIRGVIVGQSRNPLPNGFLDQPVVPVVHCGFLRDIAGDIVQPDLRGALEGLLEQVMKTHRKIVCFLAAEEALHSDRVILGAALAAAKVGGIGRIRAMLTPLVPRASDWNALVRSNPEAVIVINEKHKRLLRLKCGLSPGIPIFTLHTLPPFAGKLGMNLRMEEIGRVAVNFLEMKMRQVPLATADLHQTVLVQPSWIDASNASKLAEAG